MEDKTVFVINTVWAKDYCEKVARFYEMAGYKVDGFEITPQTEEQLDLIRYFSAIDDVVYEK